MVMLADLRASQPRDIAFRLVRAGAVFAVSFAMIDPFHVKGRMLLVAGFQTDRIRLQGPGIADFGCYRLS